MQAGSPPAAVADDELDLRAYLAVLRRQWLVVVVCVVLVAGVAVGLSLRQDEEYRADAEMLVRQRSTESLVSDSAALRNPADFERQLNNEVRILESGAMQKAVRDTYAGPLDPGDVGASVKSDTSDVVTVAVTASDPRAAADLVNHYVETYIQVRRQQRVDELLAAGSEIQTQIDSLTQQIDAVRASLADADPDQRPALEAGVAGQIASFDNQRSFYSQQLDDLQLTAGIAQSGGAQVLTPAGVPTDPVSPKPLRDGAIALVLGGLLGVGLAFLRDSLDERIRSVADLERAFPSVPVLALVPEADGSVDGSYVAVRDDPRSLTAEAFRSLRTAVKFAGIERAVSVVQVTSPITGDGKTTTVANLGVALAQGGDRVVMVCCDLRRPRIHGRFGEALTPGFTDVLVGDAPLGDALRRIDSATSLLPSGSPPPNPSELLASQRAASAVEALGEQFDMVVLDSTPVLPVTDALVVSRLADATVVVVNVQRTKRHALDRTVQLLAQVNAPLLGFVLYGVPTGAGYGGYGYGGYGYGGYGYSEDRRGRRGRRARRKAEPDPAEQAGGGRAEDEGVAVELPAHRSSA